ncbi:hypothetical protein, partial [[Clostridium] innocuum]|uniref:hypothetical protein n=1 Tax=Clostridium innocuum TaxID=1522 RepID=UPI001E2E7828
VSKKEKFRQLEEEERALLDIRKRATQEEEDRLYAQQIHNQFNGRGTNSGTNSPPSTPSPSPRRRSRMPSQSPSPRGRRISRYDHHRRQSP